MRGKARAKWLAFGVAALLAAATAASVQTASGASAACGKHACVILIEVDGLEPKDVTPASTPFMWSLAHPETVANPSLPGRAGFTWQAPRSVMSASKAANTAALLTGGHPSVTGIPADEYRIANSGGPSAPRRLGALEDAITDDDLFSDTLFQAVADQTSDSLVTLGFSGDPSLRPFMLDATNQGRSPVEPDAEGAPDFDEQDPPNPAYCPPPRRLTQDSGTEVQSQCAASDMATLNAALGELASTPAAFTYAHLSELGNIKRQVGDADRLRPLEGDQPQGAEDQDRMAVQSVLAQTDAAVATFVSRFSSGTDTQEQWKDTVLMVVGGRGYENTPQALRVGDPTGDATETLEDYVEGLAGPGELDFVPQGTVGTVYYTGGGDRAGTIENVRQKLTPLTGEVDQSPACLNAGGCIREVLTPDGEGDAVTGHPTWRTSARDVAGKPLRTEGDLLVVLKRGWSTGRVAPASSSEPQNEEASNPHIASGGGPRNRAVAALVNGPDLIVRQVSADQSDGRYPVTSGPADGADEDPTPAGDLNKVNAAPEDDADDTGHELQPETVDFAPTIAGLLGIGLPNSDRQFQGRFLQEAFRVPLEFPCEECEPEEQIQEEPLPPPIEVIRSPLKDTFFTGLMQNLKARVTDKKGRSYRRAPRGARLSTLVIEADFGKPLTKVTLSFYKRARGRRTRGSARRASRRRLKALATFAPFSVTRGHVKFRLRVPKQFKPSYVGVTVQQARKRRVSTSATGKRRPNFVGFGPKKGAIVRLRDARRLHTRKRGGRRIRR